MPNGNLSAMPQQITEQQRASIVKQYRTSGMSQDEFCAHLEATEGIHLAARTLRAWAKRFPQPRKPLGECAQLVAEAVRVLQGLLGIL
jgi:hypothetical protein